jgi:hypothetical protein
MEEISEIYEDVDIRAWAQDIRLIKIYELEELVEEHKRYIDLADEYFYPDRYTNIVMKEIEKLKEKINVLKTK